MKLLFLGGDKRQLEMIRGLYCKGHVIDVVGYDKANIPMGVINRRIDNLQVETYDVILFPVNGVKDNFLVKTDFSDCDIFLKDDFLVKAKDKVLIFTGIRTKELNILLEKANKKVVALMEDRDVTVENSIPTIEGIIGDLVFNTDHTIKGSNILVFGYGNIGRPLVSILNHMGAIVTVGVIKEEDYEHLKKKKINVIYTTDKDAMLKSLDINEIIINTVPAMILDHNYLKRINKETYLLDISSHPHGIDLKAANEMGLRIKLWLGIPSVVAPRTAGRILEKKISKIIGGEQK